jgi:nicotinamidase/pyrazinamidase
MASAQTKTNSGATSPIRLASSDALLIVDMQNDFLPGGALAVPSGDQVLPPLNGYLRLFADRRLPICATRDWHPANHCSFREQGGPWPRHCVADSPGASFAATLKLPANAIVISKGTDPRQEAYSGFQGTDLAERLRQANVRRVFVGGLATEYCVLATVKDALRAGFAVVLLTDAIRAIEAKPGDGARAEQEMVAAGVTLCRQENIA